jgi:hypothetical protein
MFWGALRLVVAAGIGWATSVAWGEINVAPSVEWLTSRELDGQRSSK